MKRIVTILVLILSVVIVGTSGCTNTGGKSSSEKLVGTYNVTSKINEGIFEKQKLLVQLPENTKSVKIVYNLKGENISGIGSDGYLGVTSKTLTKSSSQDPIFTSVDSEYLEAGIGKTIKGELTFDGGKTFFYKGDFVGGNITVYTTT